MSEFGPKNLRETVVPVEKGEKTEGEKTNPVVRAFLVQPLLGREVARRIAEGVKIEQLSFTRTLWAEKDISSVNAGQLVPLGGKVESGETKDQAMYEEAVEEGRVRLLSKKHIGTMDYKLKHPKRGALNTTVDYYVAEVLPTDVPFSSLHQDEDKFKDIHSLNYRETFRLIKRGSVKIKEQQKERQAVLIDSLLTDKQRSNFILPIPGQAELVETDVEASENIKYKLADTVKSIEGQRKIDILKNLLELADMRQEEKDEWLLEVVDADNYHKIAMLFHKFIKRYQNKIPNFADRLCHAVEISNFSFETRDKHPGRSKSEAVLRLMYLLLETHYNTDAILKVAKESILIRDFIGRLEKFLQLVSDGPGLDDSVFKSNNFSEKVRHLSNFLENDKEISENVIVGDFLEAFGLDEETINTRLAEVNEFLNYSIELMSANLDLKSAEKLQPLPEIKQEEKVQAGQYESVIVDLLKKSFSCGKPRWIEEYKEKRSSEGADREAVRQELRRIIFEARRHLVLILLTEETSKYYDSAVKAGIKGVQKVMDNQIGKVMLEKGRSPFYARSVNNAPGITLWSLDGVKTKYSTIRKVIERGYKTPNKIKDTLRGEWIPEAATEEDFQELLIEETRELPIYSVDENGNLGSVKNIQIHDRKFILDRAAELLNDPHIKIADYKPVKMPGEKFSSKSTGGGDPLRMGKFYIVYTGDDGHMEYKEQQIFVPDEIVDGDGKKIKTAWENWQSAQQRARFEVDRLRKGSEKHVHPPVELILPSGIFGREAHFIHRKKT